MIVTSHQGGLLPGRSFIRVVSHQGNLSCLRSLIRVVSHDSGPSSGWSFI